MYRAYIKDLDRIEYNDVPHEGHFIYGNLIKGIPNDSTDAIVGNLTGVTDEYIWWCSIEKGSAEQYTGLKDSNDKEIYIGDIVEVTSQYRGQLGNIYKVEFNKGEFCVKHELLSEISPSISIIGNVHENLDLLEEQHE